MASLATAGAVKHWGRSIDATIWTSPWIALEDPLNVPNQDSVCAALVRTVEKGGKLSASLTTSTIPAWALNAGKVGEAGFAGIGRKGSGWLSTFSESGSIHPTTGKVRWIKEESEIETQTRLSKRRKRVECLDAAASRLHEIEQAKKKIAQALTEQPINASLHDHLKQQGAVEILNHRY